MKPLMLIPPAQAEALYDAHLDAPAEPRGSDRHASLPWLDDESAEDEPRPQAYLPPNTGTKADGQRASAGGRNAQHWPSSSNSSRWKS